MMPSSKLLLSKSSVTSSPKNPRKSENIFFSLLIKYADQKIVVHKINSVQGQVRPGKRDKMPEADRFASLGQINRLDPAMLHLIFLFFTEKGRGNFFFFKPAGLQGRNSVGKNNFQRLFCYF